MKFSADSAARAGEFAYQKFTALPDIVTVAKPLAGGLPLGAIHRQRGICLRACSRQCMDRRSAAARWSARRHWNFSPSSKRKTCSQTCANAERNCARASKSCAAKFDFIREVRGEGLIIGIDLVDRRARRSSRKLCAKGC